MGCNCNQPTPCNQPPVLCECPTILKSDCVVFSGNDLPCSGITTGQTLTETVEQLDTFICEKVDDITNALTLRNIGTGSEVYKGTDLLGRKEIRKINAVGNLTTVTQNTNDISVSINETNLDTFIEANQKTYTLTNIGAGAQVYKDSTVVGNNTQYNVRTVVKEDLGTGASFLRDIQQNTNELNVRVKTIVSPTLSITATDTEVTISLPDSATIPALYVNDLYKPTYQDWVNAGGDLITNSAFLYKGEGTLSKPFTDSINYTSSVAYTITANTSIQNALDAYVGSGTKLNPEKVGNQIIVQENSGFYTFTGNLNYSRLDIKIEANVFSTTLGYIIDMEDVLSFNQTTDTVHITISENKTLQIQGNGFKNSGNTDATNNLVTGKTIRTFGLGYIFSANTDITKYILNADILETGNNNDGSLVFEIKCNVRAIYQGVYKVGGNARIDFYSILQSGDLGTAVDTSLKAFHQIGGNVRIFDTVKIIINGVTRINAFTFQPNVLYNTYFSINGASLGGSATTLFNKLNNENVGLTVVSLNAGTDLTITNVFDSTNMWLANFRNNTLSSGTIDFTKVDLTLGNNISSINTIGNNVIESLVTYIDRAAALLAGIPLYSAYLKTNGNAYPSTSTWVRDIVLPA